MKVSFIPLLIGAVCIGLTLSLIILHSGTGPPTKKYHPPVKSFNLEKGGLNVQNLRTASPVDKDVPSEQELAAEVHSPTSPPLPVDTDKLDGDQERPIPSDKSEQHAPESIPDAPESEPDAPESKADAPPQSEALKPLANERQEKAAPVPVAETPEVPQRPAYEEPPLVVPAADSVPQPTSLAQPLYYAKLAVEAGDVSSAFPVLRAHHSLAVEASVQAARDSADVILPRDISVTADASPTDLAESSFEFHSLERLHRALRTGAACKRPSQSVRSTSLYQTAQTLFEARAGSIAHRVKTVIEYVPANQEASSTVSFALATAYPTVTALMLRFPASGSSPSLGTGTGGSGNNNGPASAPCSAERPGSNLYIAEGPGNPLDRAEHHRWDCAQFIPDLEMLVDNLLPFEFEEVLGNILCRCNATFVPQTLPNNAYFAFWDSTTHLLRSAEKVTPASCAISNDMGSTASSWASGLRNSYIVVQRNASQSDVADGTASTGSGSAWAWSSSGSTSSTTSSSSSNKPSAAEVHAAAKRYLSVGVLSSLALDLRSRQNLWASVFLHRSARGGKGDAAEGNATSIADFLVRGAVVHTPGEVVALSDKRQRKGMDLAAGGAASGRTRTSGEQSPPEEQRRSALAGPSTQVDVVSDSVNATADARAPVAGTDAPPPVAEDLHNKSDSSRRKLIYEPSASVVSRSSIPQEDTLPREKPALTWEYPEDASAGYDVGDSGIEAALASLAESGDPAFSTPSDLFRGKTTQYSISTASRNLQRHLHARESDSYRRWMAALRATTPGEDAGKSGTELVTAAGLVYVMGRHVSLLSLKLSKLLSSSAGPAHGGGILVSLLSDPLAYRSHALLTNMMSLRNNIICRPTWTPATVAALLVSPERAALSVVQVDVVTELIVGSLLDTSAKHRHGRGSDCGVQLLEETLGGLLSMSEVSFIELPSSAQLNQLFTDLNLPKQCSAALRTRYATSSARLLELSVAQLKLGASAVLSEVPLSPARDETDQPADGVRVFRVELQHCSSSAVTKFSRKSSSSGLSLYTATQLGIIEQQKVQLLKMLLDFPLWKFKPSQHVRPWELFIRLVDTDKAGPQAKKDAVTWSVYYVGEDESAGSSDGALDAVSRNHAAYAARMRAAGAPGSSGDGLVGVSGRGNNPRSDRIQGRAVWKALEYELESHGAELAEGRFSFVEHSSGFGYVSLRLAKSFPNATVFSLEREPPKVAHHIAMANALGVLNNAICWKTESDATIFRNIYESPELFRFQLLSRSLLDNFIDTESLTDWGAMMGTLLSTALTSFVYAPHSAQVSWAMYVLFAEVFEFVPAGQSASGSRSVSGGSSAKTSSFRRYALPAVVRPMSDVFGGSAEAQDNGVMAKLVGLNSPAFHPQYPYRDFEKQWVLRDARVKGGSTAVHLSALAARDRLSDTSKDQLSAGFGIPLVRCDIVNMTRHVHHHYDYSKDGHSRTYTMRVLVNQTLSDAIMSNLGDPSRTLARSTESGIMLSTANQHGMFLGDRNNSADTPLNGIVLPLGYHPNQHNVVGVHLFRDRDTFPIPYTHIYGVTLISALRMGLEESLRDRLFKDFLKMPLYEDMAPWNIVLMGPSVDYIDYDTRDITFNKVVPQAYQVMTVLMNYKRTVEDFKRCGSKASTVYGLPYVSDCVGTYGDRSLSCPDLKLPVPCADGNCHSDYISCLRAITSQAEDIAQQQQRQRAGVESALAAHVERHSSAVVDSNIVAAMKSIVGQFNDRTASVRGYEEFFRDLQR